MYRRLILLIAVALLLFAGNAAQAGVSVGINGDWNKFRHANSGDWGIGGRLSFGGQLRGMVTFDYYFVDAGDFFENGNDNGLDMKFWEANADLVYRFPTPTVRPYLGAGVGIARHTFSGGIDALLDDNKTKTGFNILGGAEFGNGPVRPFIEVRGTFYSKDEAFLGDSNRRFITSFGILF